MAKREFPVTVQDGGEIVIESSVKLACKLLSILISTSDGHPMLLDRPEQLPITPHSYSASNARLIRSIPSRSLLLGHPRFIRR